MDTSITDKLDHSAEYRLWQEQFAELAKAQELLYDEAVLPMLYARSLTPTEAIEDFKRLTEDPSTRSIGYVPGMAVYHKQAGLGIIAEVDPTTKASWCMFIGLAPKLKVLNTALTVLPDQGAFGQFLNPKVAAYLLCPQSEREHFVDRWDAFNQAEMALPTGDMDMGFIIQPPAGST